MATSNPESNQQEIAAVKKDPRVSYELGLAYMIGKYGLEVDLYKARDYFSCEQSPPLARVLYARVNITILVREKKVKELVRQDKLETLAKRVTNQQMKICL